MCQRRTSITRGGSRLALIAAVLAISLPATDAMAQILGKAIECNRDDLKVINQNKKDVDAWIKNHNKKHKNWDEDALLKSDPQKYCKWLTESVLPWRTRHTARYEARMAKRAAEKCSYDDIMAFQRDYSVDGFKELKRRMSGPCLGLRDE